MNKRFGAIATLVAAVAAAAGLFAGPSSSASSECPKGRPGIPGCLVSLTATGPSPSTVRMAASWKLEFRNTDSRTHTVVFANGCSLTLTPRELRVLILWGGPCYKHRGRQVRRHRGNEATAPFRDPDSPNPHDPGRRTLESARTSGAERPR